MSERSWLAIYLYCAEPWEPLLALAVKPFVAEVLESGLASNYFFIRYWERGPHIRLRFFGETGKMERELRPRLVEYFERWFAANPSVRDEPEWVAGLASELQWFPNDSVQFIEYEPEEERYGGPIGMEIGEKQFRISADAVLAAIEESSEWSYSRSLGLAIQLHLGFAHAFGLDLKALQAFYRIISRAWFPRAYAATPNLSQEELNSRREETLAAFESTFASQKEMLKNYAEMLWQGLNQGAGFEPEWVNTYLEGCRQVAQQLKFHASEITCRDLYFKDLVTGLDPEQTRLWPILESYIHMTNNRLGVLNRDEAFLGYLIEKTMADIEEVAP